MMISTNRSGPSALSLSVAQKISTYLTLLCALGGLLLSGAIDETEASIMGGVLFLSWWWRLTPQRIRAMRWIWNIILSAFMVWVMVRILEDTRWVMQSAVHLVMLLTSAKLFQRVQARDDLHLHALSFLMMALSAALDQGIDFGLILAIYLSTTSLGLGLTHLYQRSERPPKGEQLQSPKIQLSRGTLWMGLGMSAALIFCTALIFFALPRFGFGLMSKEHRKPQGGMVGFSNTIDLTQHGRLGLDDRRVMTAEVEHKLDRPYWRGMAFDIFDGSRWHQSHRMLSREQLQPSSDGVYLITKGTPKGRLIRHEIELEPMNEDILFTLNNATKITISPKLQRQLRPGSSHWLQIDAGEALHHSFEHGLVLHYTIESRAEDPPQIGEELPPEHFELPNDIRQRNLQLPAQFSSRARALALKITRNVQGSEEKTRAIVEFLKTNYDYTLDLPRREGPPIEDFLFNDRQGHCAFFSTAAVLLLRSLGIPARNVNGFMGGEWNPYGKLYTVRRRDAHSWAEVFISGRGWITIEATPSGGQPPLREAERDRWAGSLWGDHLQRLWGRWVAEFSADQQGSLFDTLMGWEHEGDGLQESLTHWWSWFRAEALGWLLLLFVQGFLLWGFTRKRWGLQGAIGGWIANGGILYFFWSSTPGLPLIVFVFATPGLLYWKLRLMEIGNSKPSLPRHPLQKNHTLLLKVLSLSPQCHTIDLKRPPEALAVDLSDHGHPVLLEASLLLTRYTQLRFSAPEGSLLEQKTAARDLYKDIVRLKKRLQKIRKEASR